MEIQKVWCDGACFPNPGRGGWGWTDLSGRSGHGGLPQTTNQEMELTAALQALRGVTAAGKGVQVVTDSQYVIKGATIWTAGWRRKGWKTTAGEPVKYRALWEAIWEFTAAGGVSFVWIKGHSGDPGNEEADRLATLASGASQRTIEDCRRRYEMARCR